MERPHLFELTVRERAFDAIKRGSKKVEVRANRVNTCILSMQKGDTIVFKKLETGQSHISVIQRITLYRTIESLLLTEGIERTLSSGGTLEEGIRSIESISDYKSVIAERGVFAIVIQ